MNRRELFKSGSAAALVSVLPASLASQAVRAEISDAAPTSEVRDVRSLDKGWRFFEGDIPFPTPIGNAETYDSTKTGAAGGAANLNFDDTEWPTVQLPHDFVSFQPIEKSRNVAQGFRKRGIGWYRNLLRFEDSDRGKHIEIQLDGIATNATIWFNGTVVRHSFSGYTSSYIDVTAFATYGDTPNSLDIRVDAQSMEGWWYEGGGLYRHAWVVTRNPVHIITDGVYGFPVKTNSGWHIPVEVTLYNIDHTDAPVELISELKDGSGAVLKSARATATVPSLRHAVATFGLDYDAPNLWSVDQPNLYTIHTKVMQNGKLIDEHTYETGFRTTRWDADKGLFLNNQPIKVQGVCVHQDHAGVGVAVPDSLWAYRLKRLKELGVNAIRSAHNAPNKHVLKLADRMGFLIMDENRLFNPSPTYMEQLQWMVRRDRNHPCVYLWSVFNEEPMQGTPQGYEMVRRMREAVRELDTNRPVTAAINGGMFEPVNVTQAVDVVGFNYQQDKYDAFHKANPTIPLYSSEDTSAFMTRGEYVSDREGRHVIASYDDEAAPWGETHLAAWKAIDERPWIAGGFVWTGFDYHGEPTPLSWPANSSVFGIMDLCGFEKAAFYMHQSQWVKDRPVLWLIPHWNWKAGETVRVVACTNCEAVELFVNGKSAGKQPRTKYEMNTWYVPFAPGRIEAVGYTDGKAVSRTKVETTSDPVRLKVTPERETIQGDGIDVITFRIESQDAKGRYSQFSQDHCTFEITNGEIIGLGNGDSNASEAEKGNRRKLFNGLAQVIVRSTEGSTGQMSLTAKADGLKAAVATVKINAAKPWPYQTVSAPVQPIPVLAIAPATSTPPVEIPRNLDPLKIELWGRIYPGFINEGPSEDSYQLAVVDWTPYTRVQKQGGKLIFPKIKGKVQAFVDGKLIAEKTTEAESPFEAKLPPGMGERNLGLLFKVKAGETFGLAEKAWVATL
ncbi:beta-galactosidase GalA [Asticcacaulis sp. 201]|uniref:beta-galactosidase GalA n=1 Tax=Asticcacaulis sp. 201 TaxID=3028787 RepID=UPI00291687B5|nr:beta-galactosidase GalA [Asticcacaulis sp. 201]MDV6330682.1 beta-galactosidase GalA [Asticcacaulis sp. 201]